MLVVDTVLLLNLCLSVFSEVVAVIVVVASGWGPLPFCLACYCSWIIRWLVEYGPSFFVPCMADFLGGTVWLILILLMISKFSKNAFDITI